MGLATGACGVGSCSAAAGVSSGSGAGWTVSVCCSWSACEANSLSHWSQVAGLFSKEGLILSLCFCHVHVRQLFKIPVTVLTDVRLTWTTYHGLNWCCLEYWFRCWYGCFLGNILLWNNWCRYRRCRWLYLLLRLWWSYDDPF